MFPRAFAAANLSETDISLAPYKVSLTPLVTDRRSPRVYYLPAARYSEFLLQHPHLTLLDRLINCDTNVLLRKSRYFRGFTDADVSSRLTPISLLSLTSFSCCM